MLAAGLVAMTACNEPEVDNGGENGGKTNPPTPVVVGDVTLSETGDLVLGADGGSVRVVFKATKEWSATSSAEWLTLSPSSGAAGNAVTLTVTVAPNEGYDDREATVTVTCDQVSKTVKVVQKQKNALVFAPATIEVPQEGKELEIKLQANVEVTAAPDVDWITELKTKGLTEYTFNFQVAPNESFESRTGHIVFRSEAGSVTITIDQYALETPPMPGEGDELDCPNPPTVGTVDMTALTGYGAGVTGGANGTVLHFNSGKALQTWLLARTKTEKGGDHSPVTIWLSGTFKPDDGRDFSEAHPWFDVKDVSNLSFIGTDSFVMDRIGIFCVRAKNIVIRNINFQQPKANNGADAVSMQDCDGIWVDHCTFTSLDQTKDYEDGSTDITHGSKNVTVSWCRYIKTQKSCLVGHSNSQSGDTQITATFHHNWFEGSSSRHPRVRFGKVHVYNNFFDGNTTYGVGSAYGAKVLVEYNYFDGVQLPTDICTYPAKESGESNLQGSVAGYLWATQDILVNRPAKAKDPYPLTNIKYEKYNGSTITPLTYADFKPAYDYTVTAAADVPAVVRAGAGYGKLGFTEAPVAVNNGGITEFDGTDPNPENPDQGDEDDPGQPGGQDDGSAHTYTLSMQSKALVQTKDGAAGASYFDASTNVADFSKDYIGSFTIDGTTYSQGIKMDSKGYVNFTTSAQYTTTVRFYAVRRKADATSACMQLVPASGDPTVFDVTPHDTYLDSGEITLEKGAAYTIKQKSGEQAVILVIVKETE